MKAQLYDVEGFLILKINTLYRANSDSEAKEKFTMLANAIVEQLRLEAQDAFEVKGSVDSIKSEARG